MMFSQRRRRQVQAALAAATMGAVAAPVFAATATVSVNSTAVGVTPRFMGYNMGHYMPGSNTTAWTQYTGINAFRFWAATGDYEPTDDRAPFGDGVGDLSSFDARKNALRADLRADPSSSNYINWSYFATMFDKTQSGRNKVQLNYDLSELQKIGADVVMQITRSNAAQFEIADWGGKWEQWQHYYSMAYYAAKNYDVQRYQMYNEPDLDDIPIAEWVQRLQLASDAVKSAIEDVNTITGKKLSWSMYAPVAAHQDDTIDTWGKAALSANRTDYAGRPTSYDLFDTYDVHRYSDTGHAADQILFDSKIPQYNPSGQNLPVTYSEFNRYTSGTFSTRSDGLDTPQIAAEFGGIFPGAMSQDVKGMYAFKFNQTQWTSNGQLEPQKTGFHYVDSTDPYNITGSTRAAETYRLAIKAFKGERPRLFQTTSASDSSYDAAASYDPARGNYYFYSVNRNTTEARTVTLNLDGWNVPAGAMISVQEVSAASLGAGKSSQFITVPVSGSKTITFTQPSTSTWLLTAPSIPQAQLDLNPTADAQISHAAPLSNFGALPTAKIDRSAASDDDDAAYLKFSLAGQDKAKIGRAFLHVTGVNSTDNEPVHVYGLINPALDAWTETGINWNNAPDLGAAAADARLGNVGTDALPVGQLAWSAASAEWGIDVTDFVRKHPDTNLSFVLIREQRFAAYGSGTDFHAGDTDTSRISINTREAASGQPRLTLMMTPHPTYFWNTNFNANFSAPASWDAGIAPDGAGAIVVLGDFVTSPHTVAVNAAATVGELRFASLNGYTLSGAATLTLDGGGGAPAAINVYQGDHAIDAPLALATPTTALIDAGRTLTVSKPLSGTSTLTKTGPGALILSAASPSYARAITISGGSVQLTGADASATSGLGTGFVTIQTGGMLLGGDNLTGAGDTYRANMVLAGGAIGSTAVNAAFSGDFTNSAETTSFVDVFDAAAATPVPRDISLTGSGNSTWAGTVVVTPGTLSAGGAFNISRTGGTVAVTSGATLQINPGAAVNLGGAGDALSDGIDRVNILNSSAGGFRADAGTNNVGAISGAGSTTVNAGATLIASSVRQSDLTIVGKLQIRSNGGDDGTSNIGSLAMSNGQLDLRDNDMVIRDAAIGLWDGSQYTGIIGLIASGRDGAAWDGDGIISSSASGSLLTSLGIASADDLGVAGSIWSGQPVASGDVLVRYSYGGDADLDGRITANDYFDIDNGFLTHARAWLNGDFDYNGRVDGDDYFIIDSNYADQSTSLAAAAAGADAPLNDTTPVPDPASASLLALACGAIGARRRRIRASKKIAAAPS
jgi:autotransporter-associated beta strand protein